MATLDQIRAAILAKLKTVSGIGQVHDYERFATAEKAMRALYEYGGRILGWHLRRTARREARENARVSVTHTWEIRGFSGLDDSAASEKSFDALIETIAETFRADQTLGGLVQATSNEEEAGVQVTDSGPVMFAGVLCHSARLRLYTRHHL